jgi:hypothetical protein
LNRFIAIYMIHLGFSAFRDVPHDVLDLGRPPAKGRRRGASSAPLQTRTNR